MTHEDFIIALSNLTKFISLYGKKLRKFSIESNYPDYIILTFPFPTKHIKFDRNITFIDPLTNDTNTFDYKDIKEIFEELK